jgi:hypothetical protein
MEEERQGYITDPAPAQTKKAAKSGVSLRSRTE